MLIASIAYRQAIQGDFIQPHSSVLSLDTYGIVSRRKSCSIDAQVELAVNEDLLDQRHSQINLRDVGSISEDPGIVNAG